MNLINNRLPLLFLVLFCKFKFIFFQNKFKSLFIIFCIYLHYSWYLKLKFVLYEWFKGFKAPPIHFNFCIYFSGIMSTRSL